MPQTSPQLDTGRMQNRTAFHPSGTGSEAHGCVQPSHKGQDMFRAKEKARETERERATLRRGEGAPSEALVPSSAIRPP